MKFRKRHRDDIDTADVEALREMVKVQAWLHAELVYHTGRVQHRVTKAEAEILDLRGRSNIQAWLHAELVHQLQFIFERLVGSNGAAPATPAQQARMVQVRQRAVKIARLRAANAAKQQAAAPAKGAT